MAAKISIQGYEGSFHQMAAQQFFGKNVGVIPCGTFREVVKLASNKKESDGGVMAIENSIAGSILANYNLLQRSNLVIAGEVYLQIRQNLLVNPGVAIDDIREIHSHPMAIQQCFDFLDKHEWKLVETEDEGRKLDPFYVQDARVIYSFHKLFLKEANVILQVNNIFNKKYEPSGYTYNYISAGDLVVNNYYFPMAGTNFMLGINLRF